MNRENIHANTIVPRAEKLLVAALVLIIGIVLSVLAYMGESWEGGGDNIWHYYISKYSYAYPKFMLHHWGKPIFVLLSAPFAQFGFFSLQLFNISCGLLSAFIIYKWCRQMNFRFSWAAIAIVVFSPMYFACLQSALTEPLFSLLLVYSAFLLFNEKYLWGCVVASTIIYSRSEGIFILLIFAVYLLLTRKFKYLPFLATFFLIYSVAGALSGRDFFWFFTENPYNAESPYGKGTWLHFMDRFELIYGWPFVVLFGAGIILFVRKMILYKDYLFWKKQGTQFKIFCLVIVPVGTFFFFHVYAWAMGKFASAGEWRVMACILPLASLICLYPVDLIGKIKFPVIRAILILPILFFVVKSAFITEYPKQATLDFKLEKEVAAWFKPLRMQGSRIYYAHPGIIFYSDWDPYADDNRECFGFPNSNCVPFNGDRKFYYIWDSAFCPAYCGNTLANLEACPTLKKMKEFEKDNFKIVVFESVAPYTKAGGTCEEIK